MALFMNDDERGLFRNPKASAKNQEEYHIDTLVEALKIQQEKVKLIQQAVAELTEEQNKMASQMANRIHELDTKIEKPSTQSNEKNTPIVGELEKIQHINKQINKKLEEYDIQMNERITRLEKNQEEVIEQVDRHGGMLDKMVHQIDHVRFVLFERTDHIEGKLEKAYENILSYLEKIVGKKEKD